MKRLSIIPLAVLAVAPVSTVTAQESALKPALIGLGVGAGLGFLVGYVLTLGEHEGDPLKTCGLGERGGCILIGTAIGGGVGALFGLSYHTIFNNDAAPKALKIPAGAFLGLVVGAVPGALIGEELESKAREAGKVNTLPTVSGLTASATAWTPYLGSLSLCAASWKRGARAGPTRGSLGT